MFFPLELQLTNIINYFFDERRAPSKNSLQEEEIIDTMGKK